MTAGGPTEFHVDLRSDSDAASVARRFVQVHSEALPESLIDDAQLLVSELVTNAVLHGRPTISLEVNLDPPLIGISVRDEGAVVPTTDPHEPADSATSGRGLLIVDRVSTSWGIVPNDPPPGKTVWFRLDDDG